MTQGERGFTLLEVLVAFVIAALALGAMFSGTLAGLRATQIAGRYEEAVMRAQSHLAALTAASLTPGDRQGDDGDGFRWHIRITPIAVAVPAAAGSFGRDTSRSRALFAVSVALSWKDDSRRTVQLNSERIGLAPLRGP
jgi:general secretion pathway protein I